MTEIIKDLYQFTEVMEPIKLSMHQYLLMTNEPVLIQTGAVSQAQTTIPKLQELLGERKIKYILISHFESDECGGLALVLKRTSRSCRGLFRNHSKTTDGVWYY